MTIQRYDHNTETLDHPWSYKINKILERGCIVKDSEGSYNCLPILGYNTRTYKIHTIGRLHCNCQGFKKRNTCSHAEAVKIYRRINEGVKDELQSELF